MTKILEAVGAFFDENNWPYSPTENEAVLLTGYQGKNGEWPCFLWARDEEEQIVFYSKCPIAAPPDRRHAVAEYFNRVNYNLLIGNFELDFADGEIRFRTSISGVGDPFPTSLVEHLVFVNVSMMDRYLPGLMKVLYGDASPEEAVAEVDPPSRVDVWGVPLTT